MQTSSTVLSSVHGALGSIPNSGGKNKAFEYTKLELRREGWLKILIQESPEYTDRFETLDLDETN
jgi:hypothetical protein